VISLLDLANISFAESVAPFLSDSRLRVAELPDRIRSGINYISLNTASPAVTVMIPRDAAVTIARGRCCAGRRCYQG
jgi:hypothetical protein